jgi:hypothetical protein
VRLSREYRARLALDAWAASALGYGRYQARQTREDLGAVRRLLALWEVAREGLEWHSDARDAGAELEALAEEVAKYEALWLATATTPVARRRAYSILYELGVVNIDQRPPLGGLGRAGAIRVYHRRGKQKQKQRQQGWR